MRKGIFVSLEGIEATGKTTIANLLKEKMKNSEQEVVITREPGGIKSAETIRNVIMDNNIDVETELLLFLAARREHLSKKIIPSLQEGKIVICDRYCHSTFAYQGFGQGIDIDKVVSLNNFATNGIMPDIVFYIDIPVKVSLTRKSKVDEQNRLDKMHNDFYERVREGFLEMSQDKSFGNIITIDGNKNVEEIVDEIYEHINVMKLAKKILENVMNSDNSLETHKMYNNIIDFPLKD